MPEAPPKFVHLHVHTEYSLLDGACRVRDIMAACKRMEMPAVALTDHGNLFGAIEFYAAAREAGIKPLIGCEMYMAPGDRRDNNSGGLRESAYHQLLLAMNQEGYQNLIKLASIAYIEGFYRKPRIDKIVLREFSGGLICTSTCLGGEIPTTLAERDFSEAKACAETYLEIFGPDRFFIELQNHGLPEQVQLNPLLRDLAARLGVAAIATNDVHYLSRGDSQAHDVLLCVSTRTKRSDPDRFRFTGEEFYLKSPAEMLAALPEYREALENTLRVAEMCNVDFDFTRRYAPVFRPPEEKTAEDYLRELVYAGATERYATISDELRERIDYELSVICSKGFAGYFLIVWDFVRYAHEQGIPAVARGSGCSTVVGYCLKISTVDPLHYGLYFERFMDPERDEMPDIDIDLCQERRAQVIEYVRRKYGHVAQIITFGRLKARAAIRDICRALDVPLDQADRIAKLVPEELKMTIEKALEREPQLSEMYRSDPAVREVLDYGKRLEGLARHASVHAAGVVVADQPLDTLLPLYRAADSRDLITQFEGPMVEKIGLLKMDFLGLRTLTQIDLTRRLVARNHGVHVDLDRLDLSDPRVYALLSRGETRGVFQFESGGMRDVLMKMKPNRIFDLIAANALFRPGPMEYIDEYVARKHNRTQWTTPHSIMTEVLAETYGIMVYQEQVSRLVNRLGDVPLKRAFRLAKAISKKKESMINAEREPFLQGCLEKGLKRETAEQIFADILKFGGYAFNKAHSTGYAVVAFQTAWLKTYFPAEFMASLLTCDSGNIDKIAEYIDECKRIRWLDGRTGVSVKPPDVNESDEAFTVVYDAARAASPTAETGTARPRSNGSNGAKTAAPRPGVIRFGLTAISGVGSKAVQAILAARNDGGRFRDLFDFCERVDLTFVNKGVVEALIKAGAFDETGAMRRGMMEVLEHALDLGQKAMRRRRSNQFDMFGAFAEAAPRVAPHIPAVQWTDAEMLKFEKETLGFYITRHPLTSCQNLITRLSRHNTATVRQLEDRARVTLGGLVTRIRSVLIRQGAQSGKKLLIVTLEDFHGAIEATLRADQLVEQQAILKPDAVLFVEASVDRRKEEPSLRLSAIYPLTEALTRLTREIEVRVGADDQAAARIAALRELCNAQRGATPVLIRIQSAAGWSTLLRTRSTGVRVAPPLLHQLGELFGPAAITCLAPGGAINPSEVPADPVDAS